MGEMTKFMKEVKANEEKLERIKERIQWLLSEIDENVMDWQKIRNVFSATKDQVDKAYADGVIKGMLIAKDMIKKAFHDVLRDDKE